MLFSLILLSYIVVSNREIANTNHFLTTLAMFNLVKAKYILENIDMDEPRSRFTLTSRNTLRVPSAHSDLSSILYIK